MDWNIIQKVKNSKPKKDYKYKEYQHDYYMTVTKAKRRKENEQSIHNRRGQGSTGEDNKQ